MYVTDLSDLPRERLAEAFVRARRELTYFPQIAELRNFAGAGGVTVKREESVDAMGAWEEVQRYVKRWGVDGLPEYVRGKGLVSPPPLLPRIDYALRRIGGLKALRSIPEESFPFMLRDFCAGYNEGPVAETKGLLPRDSAFADVRPLLPEAVHEDGPQMSYPEVMKKLLEVAQKMPEPPSEHHAPAGLVRRLPPPIVLTKEQIAARKPAEREEIEWYRKAMEEE